MRAAAVGGGAYIAGKHRARAQDEQAADQPEQDQSTSPPEATAHAAAPASSGGLSEDAITKLKEISDLHASGVLTDDEFAQQKERLLA